MRSFLPFLLSLAAVAFAVPLETTGTHLSHLSLRARCPSSRKVRIDGGLHTKVQLIEKVTGNELQTPGCLYKTTQPVVFVVNDQRVRISSTLDIIGPLKGAQFTESNMDHLKKQFWVLSTFEYHDMTWVKLLSGKWRSYRDFWKPGDKRLAGHMEVQKCQENYAPVINALSQYSYVNEEKQPPPLLDNVGLREI
ncbi:hypothetical protein FRC02_002711 [Tulasnella sp. 418]|nr:hypothetical protein FRC02_002711 [Tulasnella sp. 418]